MRRRLLPIPLLIAPLFAALLWVEAPGPARAAVAAQAGADDDQPAVPDGMEVQARGPVHEAFAEPTNAAPAASAVREKAPPEPIEETPPDEKPEGDTVVWVPGYWAWDADASEYLWVSGFWRAAPPGRTWTPGHWQKVAEGHQWVPGYWAVAGEQGGAEQEVELLPPPPETIDRGPSVPAPAADFHYVPGLWVFRTTRYVWRPGFFVRHRPGWVWINACYRWTPAGYIYVPSYYDAPLLSRGLLCAPVRFVRPIYTRPAFVYRPVYFVQPDFLIGSLFVSVRRQRFYFGNYFEPRYSKRFVAWNAYRVGRSPVYDANYAYYRTAYAKYPAWERGLTALYAGRFKGDIARPPVTLVQQRKVINTITVNKTTNVFVNKTVNITNVQNTTVLAPLRRKTAVQVSALSSLANLKPSAAPVARREYKVTEMTAQRRKEEVQQANRMRTIATERRAAEARTIKTTTAATIKAPVKVKVELPRTTPPPRKIVTKEKPPEAPKRPVVDNKAKPPVVVPKPKDKDKPPPPKEKEKTPPPKPKEKPPVKEKEKPPVKEKEKEKAPPPKPKEKEKPPPPKPKDKDKPPPPKEKEKPPPPKPKEKEKPPPPKEKEKPPPPKPKEKDKGKPEAPAVVPPKAVTPPVKEKDKAPPPKGK